MVRDQRGEAEQWRPTYRDLEQEFTTIFEDAKSSWAPGWSAMETDTFPTGDALAPVDLAAIYGQESSFGSNADAYDDSTFFGGFQLGADVARDQGLEPTGTAATDPRVEWPESVLGNVDGFGPAWHEAGDLDLVESVELATPAGAAARYLFDHLRTFTFAKFEDFTGSLLEGSPDGSVTLVTDPPGVELSVFAFDGDTAKDGDDRWHTFAPGADRPTGEEAAYEGLLRALVRFHGLDKTVDELRDNVAAVAQLKADPGRYDPPIPRDRVEEFVAEYEYWLSERVLEYLRFFFLREGSHDDLDDGEAMRTASEAVTAGDLRRLTYAGYNGGYRRLLLARFKAYLRGLGEGGGTGTDGYASKVDTVRPFLHDEGRGYVEGATTIRSVLAEGFPPENAKITAVDFESDSEVVEISNPGQAKLYLGNWTVEDEAGNFVRFDEPTTLGAGEAAEFDLQSDALEKRRSRPAFNDEGGDTVYLKNEAGDTVSRFGYEIEHTDRANTDEERLVFRNSTDSSDVTHWVDYDCGHRPAGDHRSDPFPGTPSCGHCQQWTRRDVAVTMAWTMVRDGAGDGDYPRLNRSREDELTDVEEGEFYDGWRS